MGKFHLMLLLVTFIFMFSCVEETKNDGTLNFKKDNQDINNPKFKCYNPFPNDRVCVPVNWIREYSNNVYFQANLKNNNNPGKLVILKLAEGQVGFGLSEYIDLVEKAISEDTIINYKFSKMTFEGQVIFSAEFDLIMEDIPYTIVSTYFYKNGFIYDVTLKVKREFMGAYKDLFPIIFSNLEFDNAPILSKDMVLLNKEDLVLESVRIDKDSEDL